ncbi:DUF2909 family protein [Vibrio sp. SM6]|uniref:DUF2909 family protein n=1 Tax=Vibrio agarilyticus TaxID=2726741 RepID=A0A7X8TS47_9VIBR|nr:DUF2909 family protein [Vibrio agarilyticus]NLS13800.1 DUF2909 family protein [Vibrio agarilyticus]
MSSVFLFKLLLVGLLLFIILNLAKALFHMLKAPTNNKLDANSPQKPMSHYLGRRVALSVIVVLLLLIALGSGWITPNPSPY